jgi:hypothetical protein
MVSKRMPAMPRLRHRQSVELLGLPGSHFVASVSEMTVSICASIIVVPLEIV